MGMKTGVIRFNVKDRGRRFRGQDRNFDTAALADLINGGEVQERVKNGDMLGYYGHWPRVKFGMDVQEGAMVGGKQVHLEPAIRTISIKALPDGTIEHESEFLDTAPGRVAQRVWQSKAGGWSSAINAPRRGSMQVPNGFFGFDYVLEPNFTANRGYALDSAGNRIPDDGLSDEDQLVLDEAGQYQAMVEATAQVMDRVQVEYDAQAVVVTTLHEENVELQSEVMRLQRALDSAKAETAAANAEAEAAKAALPRRDDVPTRQEVLDSAMSVAVLAGETRFADADGFRKSPLPSYDAEPGKTDGPESAAERHITRRFGF